MKIIETFTCGKTGDAEKNEDRIVITPDFIAVLDGVTSKQCPPIGGKAGGKFAADTIAQAIEKFAPDITAVGAVQRLNEALREAVVAKAQLPQHIEPPSACGAVYSRHRKEVWRVGDLALIIDGVIYNDEKEVDRVTSAARALAIEIALSQGATLDDVALNDVGREQIMPLLRGQHVFVNKAGPYGYAVINGTKVPEEMIDVFDVKNVREIVIASDGYPRLFGTLEESESYLAEVLRDDPLLFRKHKSTKGLQTGNASYDDRTYVRFITEKEG